MEGFGISSIEPSGSSATRHQILMMGMELVPEMLNFLPSDMTDNPKRFY
jgi:hypothetical protein